MYHAARMHIFMKSKSWDIIEERTTVETVKRDRKSGILSHQIITLLLLSHQLLSLYFGADVISWRFSANKEGKALKVSRGLEIMSNWGDLVSASERRLQFNQRKIFHLFGNVSNWDINTQFCEIVSHKTANLWLKAYSSIEVYSQATATITSS